MFSIDTESPRFKSVLRSVQYAVLSLLVVGGTIILVFTGQGYDFNRGTGEVIQNGLLLINTSPEDSQVTINGVIESDFTPGRFALPTGEYDIGLSQDGYRNWDKRVSISPSGVEWLYYPLLLPSQLEPSRVGVWRNLEFITQSPNPQRLLVRQARDDLVFNLLNLDGAAISNDAPITPPQDILALQAGDPIGAFSFVDWASDSRHVLVGYTQGEITQYLWLDVETPALSLNLNVLFDLPLSEPKFIDGDANRLYALVNNDLRRLDLGNRTISAPLARAVSAYEATRDRYVVYLASEQGVTQLGLLDGGVTRLIKPDLAGDASRYDFDTTEFDRSFYVALLDSVGAQVSILTDPHSPNQGSPDINLSAAGARYVSFSLNGQFMVVQGGGNYTSYDLDRGRTYGFSTPFAQPIEDEMLWMDGYRLLGYDQNGQLFVFEFDGANPEQLLAANPAFNPFFTSDLNAMYSISPLDQSRNSFLMHTSFIANSVN